MTENKRFEMIITGADGSFHYLDKNTGEKITSTLELENKLNTLHEENEQLKIQIDDVTNESIGYEEQIEKLLKKNEQLKAQLQRYEIDFEQFEKECQECEKGILQIIDDKIQSARELGTVKTVIVLKNLRKEIIKCKD